MKLLRSHGILLVMLVSALVIWSFQLGNIDPRIDEIITLSAAKESLYSIFFTINRIYFHIPFYYGLLNAWTRLFGFSYASLRFPSVIFGLLSVVYIYRLSRLLDGRTAIISAVLLISNSFFFHIAREARMYSLLVFSTILSTYYFLMYLKKRTVLGGIKYSLAILLLVFSHYFAPLVLLVHFLYLICSKPPKKVVLYWLATGGLGILLISPYIFHYVYQTGSPGESVSRISVGRDLQYGTKYPNPQPSDLIRTVTVFLTNISISRGLFIFCLAAGILLLLPLRHLKKHSPLLMLYFGAITPLVLVYLISAGNLPGLSNVYNVKYLIISLPFLVMLVSFSLSRLNKYVALCLIAALVAINASSVGGGYLPGSHADYHALADFLEKEVGSNATIVSGTAFYPLKHYYHGNARMASINRYSIYDWSEVLGSLDSDEVWIALVAGRKDDIRGYQRIRRLQEYISELNASRYRAVLYSGTSFAVYKLEELDQNAE
ncbi:MAG: glycosyltransferase family 39 protein [archaeon]